LHTVVTLELSEVKDFYQNVEKIKPKAPEEVPGRV
jgi:hypothetical protein